MIKKILVTLSLILLIGFGMMVIIIKVSTPYWGHHFSFENELGLNIDSLDITVGDVTTPIIGGQNNEWELEGNIDVPEKGYPHSVTLKIYHIGEPLTLKADSFNC